MDDKDVRAATGKLSAKGAPLVRLERAAMIHFGVPSFGVHLNGYVRGDGEFCFNIKIGFFRFLGHGFESVKDQKPGAAANVLKNKWAGLLWSSPSMCGSYVGR